VVILVEVVVVLEDKAKRHHLILLMVAMVGQRLHLLLLGQLFITPVGAAVVQIIITPLQER
jgi:hypothetical protein